MSHFVVTVQLESSLPDGVDEEDVVENVEEAASATLAYAEVSAATALSILLTDNNRIRQLNRDFRGQDKPTDVLSFPADHDFPGTDDYLGDVAIALPVATSQAKADGHGLLDELSLLTIHGVLHLLGYDHLEPEDRVEMWAVQDQLLTQLHLKVRSPEPDGDA